MTYPGVYRAKCIAVSGNEITAYIPQVFATTPVPFTSRTGVLPSAGDTGWVMFEGGRSGYPVWLSPAGASGSTVAPVNTVVNNPLSVGTVLSDRVPSGPDMHTLGTITFPKGPQFATIWMSFTDTGSGDTISGFNLSFVPEPTFWVVAGLSFGALPSWYYGGTSLDVTGAAILNEPADLVSTVSAQVETSGGNPLDVKVAIVFTPITLTS